MNVERLMAVAEAVRNAPPEQFNLTNWTCGTSACAIGWYCRANPSANLRLVDNSVGWLVPQLRIGNVGSGWADVQCYFGLSSHDAWRLFDEHSYDDGTDRQAVIDRIEEFTGQRLPAQIPSTDFKTGAIAVTQHV